MYIQNSLFLLIGHWLQLNASFHVDYYFKYSFYLHTKKSWWSVNTFSSYSRSKFERKSVPAVPKKPLGGPNSQHLLSAPRAIYHSKIMTTAYPKHEVSKIKVLLQYLRQSLGGPLSNLTFVFLTPTHLPNIIRIHSRVLELSCLQTNALTYKSRYSAVGKSQVNHFRTWPSSPKPLHTYQVSWKSPS